MSTVLLLLAVAVPLWSRAGATSGRLAALNGRRRPWAGDPRVPRALAALSVGAVVAVLAGWPVGVPLGPAAGAGAWWFGGRLARPSAAEPDPLDLAATWDLLAACLRAGLPVPTAIHAVADDLPGAASRALRAAADLLAMGADPVDAWARALRCPHTAALARGARHTARSGTALADVVTTLATTVREAADDAAETRAQRAAVLIAAPLGVCFLPAFLCLGLAPVVLGLATRLSP